MTTVTLKKHKLHRKIGGIDYLGVPFHNQNCFVLNWKLLDEAKDEDWNKVNFYLKNKTKKK